jgi:hypothetical protein
MLMNPLNEAHRRYVRGLATLLAACVGGSALAADDDTQFNTVKQKLAEGGQVVGGTVSTADVDIYCAMANAGFDFLWIEMQHSPLTYHQVATISGAWRSRATDLPNRAWTPRLRARPSTAVTTGSLPRTRPRRRRRRRRRRAAGRAHERPIAPSAPRATGISGAKPTRSPGRRRCLPGRRRDR